MKKLYLTIAIFCSFVSAYAAHITGGTIYYTFLDSTATDYRYKVTLLLYRDHQSTGAPLDQTATIGVYDKATNAQAWFGVAPVAPVDLHLTNPSPCIVSPPVVWYDLGVYEYTITVPKNNAGYIIAYQRCCRIAAINNLVNSGAVGATYTAEIPGKASLPGAVANNSAKFTGTDLVIICSGNQFCYDFSATDPDPQDSLVYTFCNAYTGGTQSAPGPGLLIPPPYVSVPYAAPYSAGQPLGPGVSIDPHTGMMCGIAPAAGIYVVTVCVNEYRKGVLIATQRKDLQIKVGDCNIAKAALLPSYPTCDGFTRTFSNEAPPNPAIHSYYWDFGVKSDPNANSTLANPTYTYPDTGVYVLKLVVNRGEQCADSTTSLVKVYPGFFPGFTFAGVCSGKPTNFTDTSKTKYGIIDSWSWNFGDPATTADVSKAQNPSYTYPQQGTYHSMFIVTSSKGCIDTIYKDIPIMDKPPLSVAFKDTLICRGDQVQLHAIGTGTFTWTPVTNIVNENTADPVVSPTATQVYNVLLNDNGCLNNADVQVRVVNFVTLQARADTSICLTDSIQLFAVSDGLRFQWSPAGDFKNATVQNPIVRPSAANNLYTVKASIGGCNTTATVQVKTVPYPQANAGADTAICYGSTAQLHGSTKASNFTWSPSNTLTNANTLDPVSSPKRDTSSYILAVFDTLGCPKPAFDTVTVIRLPKVYANAGRDTAVIAGQPLQLNATGGISYVWKPGTGLSNTLIPNPIGHYNGSFEYITYQVNVSDSLGCSDSAFVTVRIFKTEPRIFVPTGFTPNSDGKNDSFRPIAAGIDKILYFRVFNRWGQLVFETTENGKGWDGKLNGKEQGTGVYVWVVKAVDYLGNEFFAKGTTVLIR